MKSTKFPKLMGFIAALFLLSFTTANCQQKIQIKENTAIIGHFFVEVLHNMPGAPMKHFQGDGGNVEVESGTNKFILRMQNFIWYDPDTKTELVFDIDKININSTPEFSFKQQTKKINLKPIPSYIRDIYFELSGTGKVKMSIPFEYEGKQSRFLQEFTVNKMAVTASVDETAPQKIRLSDIKADWSAVDKDNKIDVQEFIATYEEVRKALKYLKKARKILDEIIAKEAIAEKYEAKKSQFANNRLEEKTVIKESTLDSENKELSNIDDLEEEIKETVDNLNEKESVKPVISEVFRDLSLQYGDQTKTVKIGFKEMPIQLNFFKEEEESSILNTVSIGKFQGDTSIVVNKKLLNRSNVAGKFSAFALKNAYGTEILREDFIIDNTVSQSYIVPTIIGIGLLLLGAGFFVFFNKKKKQKIQQEYKKKAAENLKKNVIGQQTVSEMPVKQSTEVVKSKTKTKIKIGQKATSAAIKSNVPQTSVPRKSTGSRIKISRKKKSGQELSHDELLLAIKSSNALHLNLQTLWQDTAISNVYLSATFIQELDNFLAESSNEGIQNELQGAVPEVGGFMMGRFSRVDNSIHVLYEKFVPFVPEYNDVFKIEIGTKTIVDELGDAQDKNPDMEVVGWFHTHPGHGLFLSTSDLSVQRHFARDYQVAMEIDSLTKGLDMSIFTRKSTGRMNNSNDRMSDAWFQWVDIDNMNTK